ncbi:hypothetical protein L596_014190 [Steinernema carpocapsae]|uniref:Uncharacterized protein n=1 Tax=Steinernema carpocapsae TaxID=34508 RepID=A0A4U5NB39_STECR|nr:hypothetical protein L596_014190 [Steinernema carpocapsae]
MEMSSIDSPISISSQGENEEEEHSTFTKTYVREKRPLEEKCDISLLHPEELECEDVTPVTSPEHELSDEDSNTQMDFPSIRGASVEEINNCVYYMLRSSENDPEEAVTKESKEDTEKEEKIEPPRKASKKRRSKSHGPSKRSRRAREGLRHSSSVPNFIHTLTSEWVTPKVARSFDDILFAIGQVVGNAEMPEAQRSLCVYAQHNTPAPVIQQNVIVHQNVSVQQHVTVTDEDGNETTTVTNETSTSTTVTKQTQFIQQPSGDLMKIACREKTEEQQMAVLPAPEAESEKPIVEELEEEFIDDSAVVLTTVSDGPEPQIEEPEAEEPEESFTWEGVGQGGPEIKELEAEEPECEELEEKEPEVLEPEEIMEPPKELEEIQEAKIEDYSETLSPVSVSSEPESEESEDEGKSGEDEESDAMSSESDVLENEEYKHGRGQELAVVFEEFVEEPAIEEEHEKVAGIEERVFYAEKLEEGLTDAELMGEFPEERKESSEDESKEITEELEEDSESEVEQSDSEVESDEEENWRGNPESDAISVEERQVGTPNSFFMFRSLD